MDWSSRAKIIVFSAVPVLLLVACAEYFAAGTIYRRGSVLADSATGTSEYRMQIGRFPWGRVSITPLNSLGYPDREFADVLPKGECVHIVFAGDSYVFGDGVNREDNFVELVARRRAEQNGGPCVRFFNVAERATTIEQHAQHVRRTLPLLEPDIVLLGQYQNDLTDLTKPGFAAYDLPTAAPGTTRWTAVRERLRIFNLSIVRWLSYHAFAIAIERGFDWDVLEHWSIFEQPGNEATAERLTALYEELYGDLVNELHEGDIAMGALLLPSKFDVMAMRSPEEAFFGRLADEYGVPYLRLLPVIEANRRPTPFLMYDGHLNERGNALIAGALYRWLFEDEPATFPMLRQDVGHHSPPGTP